MAWIAVDNSDDEWIYHLKPIRDKIQWESRDGHDFILLPKGSIKKLIGRDLTWDDEPVELKEN